MTCQVLTSPETPRGPRLARPAIVNVLLLVHPFIQAVLLSRLGKHISRDASPVKEIKNKGETGGASFPCQSVKEKQCQSGCPIPAFYRWLRLRRASALGAPCFLPPVPLRWFIAASVCCQSRLPLGPPPGQPVYKAPGRRRVFLARKKKLIKSFPFFSFFFLFFNCEALFGFVGFFSTVCISGARKISKCSCQVILFAECVVHTNDSRCLSDSKTLN